MVVVVDTNVFVAALLRGEGSSREVLRACLDGRLQPLMGVSLLAEYESLLARQELFRGSKLTERERDRILDGFLSTCRWVRIYFLWRPNLRDEADNHLIELAVAGGARALVTKNLRDFRGAELQFPELRVVHPDWLSKELTHGNADDSAV